MKEKAYDAPSTLGMFVIKVNIVSDNNLCVLDTSCGSHIYIDMHSLKNSRQLNKGESDLAIGNEVRVTALVVCHIF